MPLIRIRTQLWLIALPFACACVSASAQEAIPVPQPDAIAPTPAVRQADSPPLILRPPSGTSISESSADPKEAELVTESPLDPLPQTPAVPLRRPPSSSVPAPNVRNPATYRPVPPVAPPASARTTQPMGGVPSRPSAAARIPATAPETPSRRYQVYRQYDRYGRQQLVLVPVPESAVRNRGIFSRNVPAAYVVPSDPRAVRTPNGVAPAVIAIPVPADAETPPGYVPGQPIRNAIRARWR